jgi:hypothetical protein
MCGRYCRGRQLLSDGGPAQRSLGARCGAGRGCEPRGLGAAGQEGMRAARGFQDSCKRPITEWERSTLGRHRARLWVAEMVAQGCTSEKPNDVTLRALADWERQERVLARRRAGRDESGRCAALCLRVAASRPGRGVRALAERNRGRSRVSLPPGHPGKSSQFTILRARARPVRR